MKKKSILISAALLVLAFFCQAAAQETKLTWLGHAAFSITTPNGKVLLIDPWLRNPANPDVKAGKDPLAAISRIDYILITHGHRDHVGDAVEVAKKTGAKLIANPELARNLVKLTDFPEQQAADHIMQMGGEIQIADGEVTIAMTEAAHSSSVFNLRRQSRRIRHHDQERPDHLSHRRYRVLQRHGGYRRDVLARSRAH
jgi:L-ascorbate metabolism protein UlaG (beta-lactamase superfamily)